jgi:hypothetical protein
MCRVALFVLVAGACAVAGLLPMTPRYPEGLKWWALRLERREPYMTAADVAAVVDAVSSRHSAGPRARIEVVPTGDGLWLYPASKDRFTTHAPLFCDVPAHGLLVHVAPGLDTAFPKLASRTRGATLIHRRGEHRWYLKPLETVPRAADNAARSGD